jgi:RHS repeat-associated protein
MRPNRSEKFKNAVESAHSHMRPRLSLIAFVLLVLGAFLAPRPAVASLTTDSEPSIKTLASSNLLVDLPLLIEGDQPSAPCDVFCFEPLNLSRSVRIFPEKDVLAWRVFGPLNPTGPNYYAKARYYEPTIGRFISQDSFLGNVDDPPSLHRYFYANANPTRFIDPSGHQNKEFEEALINLETGHTVAMIKSPENVEVIEPMTQERRIQKLSTLTYHYTKAYGKEAAKIWVATAVTLPAGAGAGLLARPLGTAATAMVSDAAAGGAFFGTHAKLHGASNKETLKQIGIGAVTGVGVGQAVRALSPGPMITLTSEEPGLLMPSARTGVQQPSNNAPSASVVHEPEAPPSGGPAKTSVVSAEGVPAPESPVEAPRSVGGTRQIGRHTVGPYKDVGGHHPHQQAARTGDPNYRPREALAVKSGTYDHKAISKEQIRLNAEARRSGESYDLPKEEAVARESMREGGVTDQEIDEILAADRDVLAEQGALHPRRIPGTRRGE